MSDDNLQYCPSETTITTKLSNIDIKKVIMGCKCTGKEVAWYDDSAIPSYKGDLKSPINFYWRYPTSKDANFRPSASVVRSWAKDACKYHKIPYILLALILQNENNPNAAEWRKYAQFVERTVTSASQITDNLLFDLIPDRISKGSSGIANVSNQALIDGANSSIKNYCRPVIPSSVAKSGWGINTDSRVSGDDWKNDMYYAAAHIRFLIDRELGECFNGMMTDDNLRLIIENYNGSGPQAIRYAEVAMGNLEMAKKGKGVLYFYEK